MSETTYHLFQQGRAQLERGLRSQEILKQAQFEPFSLAKEVTIIYALTNGFLAWAPDGMRLAAVGVPGSANASIWIVEPDRSQPFRKLIELPGEVRPRGITWTSDGSSLIFGRQEALSDLVLLERPE